MDCINLAVFFQSVYMYLLVSARSVNSGSTEKLQLKIKEKLLLFEPASCQSYPKQCEA